MLGDSGSGVVLADNRAAGNFTHILLPDAVRYPGSNLAGMRMTEILRILGGGIRLMNADGSPSGSGGRKCSSGGASTGVGAGTGIVDTVEQTAGAVGEDVEGAADGADDAVEDAGGEVDDAVEKVGKTVRDAV